MIGIDFEYKGNSEKDYELVSVSVCDENATKRSWWLYKNPKGIEEFKKYMWCIKGATLISYAVMAEARCLLTLGIDPLDYEFIDLYLEWRQLKNRNDLWNFGKVKNKEGEIVSSEPHHVFGSYHKETGFGLTDCVLRVLGIDLDSKYKNEMRDLIINNKEFSEDEKDRIIKYCEGDTIYLHDIFNKISRYYDVKFGIDNHDAFKIRGRFAASLSKAERHGIPLDMRALGNIQKNHDLIEDKIIKDMNSTFEMFIKDKRTKRWVFKQKLFTEFIESLKIIDWPKTAKGKLSTESKTIEKYRHYPDVEKLYQTLKVRKSIVFMKHPEKMGSYIGTDGYIRPYFGILGTQTGRNAAKATSFPPAMSNWCRRLMRPPKGKTIIGIDYGSQEFAVAAALSGDKNMREAYESGDPYLAFAKKAKAVPEDGKREDYKDIRNLFKATTLGLQFGMGVNKLSDKLTQDMGKKISVDEAKELAQLHRKVFSTYWNWLNACEYSMFDNDYLRTKDGWMMFSGQKNSLSIKNFLVQGTAASIMRRSVVLATEQNLDIVFPLHDAIYFICDDDKLDETIKKASEIMAEANNTFIDIDVRLDVETHSHDELWIEPRGRPAYDKLKEYIE